MKRLLFILLLIFLGTSCKGQKQDQTQSLELALETFINQEIEKHKIPSLAVGIVQNGEVVMAKGYGFADVEKKSPATEHTIYQIGSVSKMFTGHVLARLLLKKEISLDDKVSKFFPEHVNFPLSPSGQSPRIKNIATHSSEFPRYPHNLERIDPHPIKAYTKEQMYEAIEQISIDTLIGSRYNYSNFGYGVLGTAMENLTEKSLAKLMDEIIFAPYGMKSSSLLPTASIEKKLATPYLAVSPYEQTEPWNMEALSAAGNVFSSIADLNKFMLELSSNQEVNQVQQSEYFKINDSWSYGLGCFIVESKKRETKVIFHGGDIDGYASSLSLYPEHKLGIVMLTNWGEGQVIGVAFDGIYEIILDYYLGPIQEN